MYTSTDLIDAQIVRALKGGSDALLNICYVSCITSIETLQSLISVEIDPLARIEELTIIAREQGIESSIAFVRKLVFNFIDEVGIPFSNLFHSIF